MDEALYLKPLGNEDIRLLAVQPVPEGSEAAPLTYKLTRHVLNDAPPFTAISYTWGDPTITEPIYCEEYAIQVTSNLASVLRRLRHRVGSLFWVDAICINQKNTNEKANQVPLMRAIFTAASEVLVWLGEEAENSSLALKFVPDLIQAWRNSSHPVVDSDVERSDRVSYQGLGLPPTKSMAWSAFRALLSRSYFQRTWIIQEIAVAETVSVLCGNDEVIPWTSLIEASLFVLTREFYHDEPRLSSIMMIDAIRTNTITGGPSSNFETYTMFELLNMTRSSVCSDPRDRMFAYLGISSDGNADLMHKPDYTVSVEALYHHFAWFHILQHKTLDILSAAGFHDATSGLPSWVPDWRYDVPFPAQARELDLVCNYEYRLWDDHAFQLLPDEVTNIAHFLSARQYPPILELSGKEFDVIDEVAPLFVVEKDRSQQSPDSLRSIFEQWEKLASSLKSYPTKVSVLEVYWRCLVLDSDDYNRKPKPHFAVFFAFWYKEYGAGVFASANEELQKHLRDIRLIKGDRKYFQPSEFDSEILKEEISKNPEDVEIRLNMEFGNIEYIRRTVKEAIATYQDCNHLACYGRRLFTTRKGYLGIGSGVVESGQSIVVLPGANLPLVLRKTTKGHHILRGECFIYGVSPKDMMDDESTNQQIFQLV